MMKPFRLSVSRYAIAFLAVALATGVRIALKEELGNRQPFLTFYFAIMIAAWFGGIGPSLLALALSAMSASYFLLEPFGQPRVIRTTSEISLINFFVIGSTIILFGEANRAVRRRLEREIGERLENERKVREGEEQVRLLLDSTGEAIYGVDLQGLCTFSNPACARMLGAEGPEALIGQHMHTLIHHTKADGTLHSVDDCRIDQAARDGKETHADDEVFWRLDGTSFPVEYRSSPIRRDGQVVGSVVSFVDISQRTWADQTISEQVRLARYGRVVVAALSQSDSLQEMLNRCAQATVDRLDSAFARIWTIDESGKFLELQASAGLYTHINGDHGRIPVGRFKIGMIAESRQPHLTNSVVGDPQVPEQEWARRLGMVSFAGYPLVVDDRLVGVMATFARHPLSDAAIQMMGSVANEIAVGIDRKRAEEKLLRHQEWLKVTLASIGDAVIATDTESRVTFLNPVAERLTGWSQHDAVGQPLGDVFRIINEYTREPVENPASRALRDGSIIGLANHTILIARDGSELAIDDCASPIREGFGQVAGAVLVFRDVTEARAEERLRTQSEERFRALVAASSQIVWRATPEGSVILDSQGWRALTGQTYDEWVGSGWLDALHPDDRVQAAECWKAAVESRSTYSNEYRIRHVDGSYRWTAVRGVPVLDQEGSIREWVGMNIDINERKEAEQALKAAKEEAERANEAKSQFLAVLSHELRTPLNPILLAASAMLERPAEPADLRSTMMMIRNNVNLQARLIDDLLDVVRIVQGKMPLYWEVTDCHRLIHQAVQICQSEIYGKSLQLKIDAKAHLSMVNADPARLQQVFWNLIKNAVKFTPENGSILIRTDNEIDEEEVSQVIIEVTDTGIGIESSVLPKIFDPFQQGETTITRKFGGLGLGLAICKGIIEAHGGTLSADSPGIGHGATFRLALKALPTSAVEGSGEIMTLRDPAERNYPSTLKILVVEDEPATLRLMARLLKNLGHSVSTANTIADGTESFETNHFDLIISDIGLPDGSGLELIRRAVSLRGPVPAIALTGFGMEEDIRRSQEAGFTAHLTKPIDFSKLEAMIQRVAPVRP